MHRLLILLLAVTALAKEHRDPSGFNVNIPDNWQVRTYDGGVVMVNSPSPAKFVLIMPILSRSRDCGSLLRANLTGGWQAFPGAGDLQIEPGNRGAVARFTFQQRQNRGMILCAETSSRTGM